MRPQTKPDGAAPRPSLSVQSLPRTIAVQFVVILAPIALVLFYQLGADIERAQTGRLEREYLALSQRAQTHYRTFLDTLVDAVDTGRAGSRTLEALAQTGRALGDLSASTGDADMEPLLREAVALQEAIAADPAMETLLPLRPAINALRGRLDALVVEHDVRVQTNLAKFAEGTQRQTWLVMVATLFTTCWAVGSIYFLITGLTDPLNRSVGLAERTAAGDFSGHVSVDTSRDIGGLLASLVAMRSKLRALFDDLARNQARLSNAQHIARMCDWELDLATRELTTSDSWLAVLGLESRPYAARTRGIPLELVHDEDRTQVEAALEAAEHRCEPFSIDFRFMSPSLGLRFLHGQAEVRRDTSDTPVSLQGTIQDITARKSAEQQIKHLALHDGLTGLPNRTFFAAQGERALAFATRAHQTLGVLFIDLDGFKHVNDTLGHVAGDEILKQVATRLVTSLRTTDLVTSTRDDTGEDILFRMGGDEFTILLTSLRDADDASRVARRILAALAKPWTVCDREIALSASIGIAIFPTDSENFATLLQHADLAMYHAKAEGRGMYRFYSQSMQTEAARQLALEAALVQALSRQEFVLHYQVQVDSDTCRIVGAEALIRWQHPTLGLIPPSDFIPVAEKCGLIHDIGRWVLQTACAHASDWQRAGLGSIAVAVNVWSGSFLRDDLLDTVTKSLAASGLDARLLELEITESAMMSDVDSIIIMLAKLNGMGVRLSIDDFGTGFSSLSYLQRLPLHKVKVDRSFVRTIGTDQGSVLVQAIIALSRSLGLELIAEGVETEAQAAFLKSLGCAQMQGFLYGRPVPVEEMVVMLERQVQDGPAVAPTACPAGGPVAGSIAAA